MKVQCTEYRAEMTLLGLKKRLGDNKLEKHEKAEIEAKIKELEKALGMD